MSPGNDVEVTFTASHDRRVVVSADRQRITHSAMAWSAEYTPETLLVWLDFYEEKAKHPKTPHCLADVEVLRAARELLVKGRAAT